MGIFLPDPRFHGNKQNGRQMIEFIAHLEKNNTLEVKQTWPCGLECCVLLDSFYKICIKNILTFINICILFRILISSASKCEIFHYFFLLIATNIKQKNKMFVYRL